jgi:hypothetical protein
MNIKICILLPLFLVPGWAKSQATLLHHRSHAGELIERYEIRTGKLRSGVYSAMKPFSRDAIQALRESLDTADLQFSRSDKFNMDYLAAENLPWTDAEEAASKKAILSYFYESKANYFEISKDDFFLALNPGLYFQAGHSNIDEKPLFINTRAAEIRGSINNRLGFYSFISENQLRAARHEKEYFATYRALPGAHLVKGFKDDGYDFFNASGYITFKVMPAIDMQFGQSANFIGYGRRSLLLSDFATDYLFLKVNTKVNRFHYQNIFAKMTDRYGGFSRPLPSKYMAAHYLGIDVFDNLNIGLFESVIFHDNKGDGRGFDMHYLNPIIFYRSVEHQIGDPDKMLIGLNLGYIPVKNIKLYGQLMINEFKLTHVRQRNGWAHNKYGYQAGMKYIDVAGISNLDLGVEYNRVRPYSYTHYTISGTYPVNSYSHYNQHLAHPLGANFSEWIFTLKSQPWPKIAAGTDVIFARYGEDSEGSNWGQNIFLDYSTHEQEFGNTVGQGISTSLLIAEAWFSYHWKHNLFIDVDIRYRRKNSEITDRNSENIFIGAGLRLNLNKRKWEY